MATGMTAEPLPIAIRVYPQPQGMGRRGKARGLQYWRRPTTMLVFDTETRTDATQALLFGGYRFYDQGRCLEEGLFVGDDLSRSDREIMEPYVKAHPADTDRRFGAPKLSLLSRRDFVEEKLYDVAVGQRGLIVGFNLPFDLSRLACSSGLARGRFAGGFSFVLSDYVDENGTRQINKYRPRVVIKHIDSKRSFIGLTSVHDPDPIDLIPEGSATGEPDRSFGFRGHFLDCRTLAFALADQGYTLEGACKAFGVEHGKGAIEQHGIVTTNYIDYNRRDVLATAELATKLLEEYDRFGIALQETRAYSPASVGKAHLRAMGIPPILDRK